MSRYTVVIDRLADWKWPSEGLDLVTAEQFLARRQQRASAQRIVNLCRRYGYLSAGYYCSLLAEARAQLPMPTVADVLALSRKSLYEFAVPELEERLARTAKRLREPPTEPFVLRVYFGRTGDRRFRRLASESFDLFRFPMLRLRIEPGERWKVRSIRAMGIHQVPAEDGAVFLAALRSYTRTRNLPRGGRAPTLYNLAILHEPGERLPPSNAAALERFVRAGQALRMDVELITHRDYRRIPEFDALFIRTTTNIDHYTYHFARKAEQEGLVVIDDPQAILRCTNKVYLHELLERSAVATPRSRTIARSAFDDEAIADLEKHFGYPVVLKIPDGSFSRGMRKAGNREELREYAAELLNNSRLILAQEFMYTSFDWRVGVLNGQPLFLCKYLMSRKHWQVVDHRADGSIREGGFTCLPVEEGPPELLKLAVRASSLMGDGLYGVDLKQTDAGFHVIEVNDNPNIDHGVEDKVLGDALYTRVVEEFIRRIKAPRGG